ncbi:MAG: hypothetical protein COV72_08110 [Candidatus Omnitrophica bacterium CG11_big_fil_rev_8_21_14_0_20_42_13]|uniref:Uncharacterized protein n=1 Tax=Candidatus Ghiorseimicrobium undicola TaxID=1974746 RepID=A0A2H0LVN7_9BACT|nr:MAG: hypothetical protein COV72_08110 [Candidatus Omnitrophica bacterium CG11_big_fil_rev_8_21_14_0_20_42_13]
MMTNHEKEELKIILEHLWHDERKHYQEMPCKNHIYTVLRRLAKRIGYKGEAKPYFSWKLV